MTTTNEWDDAARKAAGTITIDEDGGGRVNEEVLALHITRAFAELREVYGKLIELAECSKVMQTKGGNWLRSARRTSEIINDPLVVAAIERSKG